MNALKRLGRFLWLLTRGPLKGLIGLAGGLAILWVFWLIGSTIFGATGVGDIVCFGALGVLIAGLIICVIALLVILCFAIRDMWHQSAHPL